MALGDVIARLAVSLTLETAAFEEGATIAEKRMAQSQKRFEALGKKLSGLGKAMSLAVTAPLIALGKISYDAAKESADALGQVQSALKSMGNASGRTLAQLQALAANQMGKSLYDDDEILRKVTANLLTFGQLSGTAFDQAQQAAIDLSARLGQDLQSSAIMVGKALNDPIKGLASLRRVGIQFTEEQQAQIKAMVEAGNVAGAQAVMLQELQHQFGGAAAAARAADPTAASKQAWEDFKETIGKFVIEVLPPLTEFLTRVLQGFNDLSPGMQKVIVVAGALIAVLGPVLTVFGSMITVGAPLLAFLGGLGPVIATVARAMLLLAANPVILGLSAVILGIYLAWKNWDKIEPIVMRLYTAVKTWVLDKLGAVWKSVKDKIDAVKGWFHGLYDAVVGHSYIPDMVAGIAAEMAKLDAVMVNPAKAAAGKTGQAFDELSQRVQTLMARLFPEADALNQHVKDMAAIDAAEKSGRLTPSTATEARIRAATEYAQTSAQLSPALAPGFGDQPLVDMKGGVMSLSDALGKLSGKAQETTVRVAKSFKDMADETLSKLNSLAQAIKGGKFLDILSAVIGLGLQLGSIGAFGKKIQTNINASVPHYASGTDFHPGGMALVGERGPELVSLPRGSRVTPNAQLGGRNLVEIVDTTGLFRFRVNGQIMEAAPSIASAGGDVGVQRLQYRQTRRVA